MAVNMKMSKFHFIEILNKINKKSKLRWTIERKYFKKSKSILAIDEAGRGSLAGPVAVGGLLLTKKTFTYIKSFSPLDSKKTNPREREAIYFFLKRNPAVKFKNCLISAKLIDKLGIVEAVNLGIKRLYQFFKPDIIFLDGYKPKNLDLPVEIKAFIKGDQKLPSIALASVIAKYKRDEYMKKISSKYPIYLFHLHKGYGTKLHLKLLQKYGCCCLHRKSFLKN